MHHLRLLRTLDKHPHTGIQTSAVAAHRDRQYSRPTGLDQAFDTAGVFSCVRTVPMTGRVR
ncbi:Uncharacterised protein [Mycobacterium tuberculosis]|nr:Uncharacterised protein [Mycobacterium tuberculosis]